MTPLIDSITGLVFFLLASSSWGQLAIYGDVYVSKNNQLHIAFQDTFFQGGKLITDSEAIPTGIVSFGSQSKWQQLDRNSFVDGTVRIYHKGEFTFPIGSEEIFSPLTLEILENEGYIEATYQKRPPYFSNYTASDFQIPQYHYWSWKTSGEAIARIRTYWWEHHRLHRMSFNPFAIAELHFGLRKNLKWDFKLGHPTDNPFTKEHTLSVNYGSSLLLEPLNLADYQGISFSLRKPSTALKEFLVSQVITPNNDGINDTWKIKGYTFSSKSSISIYNLNGVLVFQHLGEYHNDWGATTSRSGKKLDEGSYFYVIDLDGNKVPELEGWVLVKYR
jgi:gliding motility-associated-like protein